MLRARSMRTGVTSVPNADSTLALTGNTTRGDSSSSATPHACTGPAPPNASSVTPRRSAPCSTACIRDAAAMFWLTSSWMPAAVSCADRPSGSATERSAAAQASMSSAMSPPRKNDGIEQTEREVGVGDRGLGAAAAVARRSGIGAGRLGPDLQQAELVDAGQAAAAGADLDQVDRRHRHREPGALLEPVDASDLERVASARARRRR